MVHRLVMLAFVGACPEGMEVAHKNGNPTDNRLENLEYKTHKENMEDKKKHGTANTGSRHGMSKLTEELVLCMRRDHATGLFTIQELADAYGVSRSAIDNIVHRRRWTHI